MKKKRLEEKRICILASESTKKKTQARTPTKGFCSVYRREHRVELNCMANETGMKSYGAATDGWQKKNRMEQQMNGDR